MPQTNQNIKFYYGTQAEYNALPTKNQNAFYIITDNKKIYIGDSLYTYTVNNEATTESAGLMTAADKAKLNKIKISDNATVEFCTTTEYEQMGTRNSNIYFILDKIGAQLLVKNENGDDLLNNVNISNNLFSSSKSVNTFPLVYNVPAQTTSLSDMITSVEE